MSDVDFDLDEALERLMLPRDVLVPMLQKFTADYAEVGATLRGHVDAGETETAADLAHSVKGVSGSLGMTRLHTVSATLEKRLRDGDVAGIEADVDAFDDALSRATAKINEEIA